MNFFNKKFLFVNGILLTVLLAHSMYRDFQLERQYPMDLRNRVVGSRLQKDEKLPYDYHWQQHDGTRYYDLYNWIKDGKSVSNITASPFFHAIFNPLAELPQRTVSRIWMWLQYFFLGSMIWMFCRMTSGKKEKWLIINLGIVFTTTAAWVALISYGQLYFFAAFLVSGIVFTLLKNTKWWIMGAGALAAAFVLTRPIAIVLFVPFLFFYRTYFLFLNTAFAALGVYLIFVLTSPYEQSLYRNYFSSMKIHAYYHILDDSTSSVHMNPAIVPYNIEGFDRRAVKRLEYEYPVFVGSESGNVFVLYNKITHSKMSMTLLNICSMVMFLMISGSFYFYSRKYMPDTRQVLLLGFLLYLGIELFSPVHRVQYNTVQWLPLLFTSILLIKKSNPYYFILLLTGLLLNISNASWIPMRHTIGEYTWFLTMLLIIFSYPQNKEPSHNREGSLNLLP